MFIDMDAPTTNSFEEDLLAQYFWNQEGWKSQEDEAWFVEGTQSCDPLSMLSSRGTTTVSSNSSETESADEASDMDKSHKLTEATRDTANFQPSFEFPTSPKQQPIQREIFLISKLKKRPPRRSFDLGELKSNQEIVFTEDEPSVVTRPQAPASTLGVDKERLSNTYNKMVDEGFCSAHAIKELNQSEIEILEILLKLRLVLTKAIPENYSKSLTANIDDLNCLLSKATHLKKRSEELLKKNFKTTLKIMLDNFKKNLPKNTSAAQSRKLFTEKFFGTKAREYDKIFKCIQMSQEYYSNIFKFSDFQKGFSAAHQEFMSQFFSDRQSKTDNLITQIKSELLSGKDVKMNLRTPWSIKEAESSMKMMAQFF